MIKRITQAIVFAFWLLLSTAAFATCPSSCFWIGGTGTLDLTTDTAHWSASSGGVSCNPCEPNSTSLLTFDGASGGGTVTVNTNITASGITADAFTGTLDWATNNNNVTINGNSSFSMSGSATHTLNMGSGTWTLNGPTGSSSILTFSIGTDSALTLSAANVNMVFPAITGTGTRTINLGAATHTFGTLTFQQQTSKNDPITFQYAAGTTITNLTINGGNFLNIGSALTVTNLTVNGATNFPAVLTGSAAGSGAPVTITTSNPVSNWGMFRSIVLSGGTATFTNCFDMLANTFNSNTCSAPAAGTGVASIFGSGI